MNITTTSDLLSFYYLQNRQKAQEKAMIQLSTARRVNKASDDPAGLAISNRMKNRISSYQTGTKNVNDASSMLSTADGATSSLDKILNKMKDLSIQANNGTLNNSDRQSIQKEFDQLKKEYDHITETTTFNGSKVLSNTSALHVNSGEGTETIQTTDLSSGVSNAVNLENINLTAPGGAQTALTQIQDALKAVSDTRTSFGAQENALAQRVNVNAAMEIEQTRAVSKIEDADIAQSVSDLVKQNILSQSTIAAMKLQQSNSSMMTQLL